MDYGQLEAQKASEIQAELQKQLAQHSSAGKIDSLRHTILRFVAEGNYDMAHSELDRYIDQQREYRPFLIRTQPYVTHTHDIINAIKTKRSLPALSGMSMARNQELFERVLAHFDELKQNLHKIEMVEKEVKIDDLRSTIWPLKVFFHGLFAIFLLALAKSVIFGGLAANFNIVVDDIITRLLGRF